MISIHYKSIRRVVITGNATEQKEAMDWAFNNSYTVKRTGPKVRNYLADTSRFKIIAEKEI